MVSGSIGENMILINVQPSTGTTARFVRSPTHPPALVVTDGPTTVYFGAGLGAPGLGHAADFADHLVTAAEQWSASCRELAAPATTRPYVEHGP